MTAEMHTPGPWRLRELANDTLAVYGAGEYEIVFPKRFAPVDADARLIAAAPDMLAALTEIAEGKGRFSQDRFEHACNVIGDMKTIARAAIEKAQGNDLYETARATLDAHIAEQAPEIADAMRVISKALGIQHSRSGETQ